MKWLSFSGIIKETKRIHWPSMKSMVRNSSIVIIFVAAFALYFLGVETLVSFILKLMGIGA